MTRIIRFKTKEEKRTKRHNRVRAKIAGSALCPRLSIFRSNKHLFAQLIDDVAGRTLVSVADKEIKIGAKKEKGVQTKVLIGAQVGKLLAEKAIIEKITQAVFDRGGYRFTGRVKAIAEGARAGGLKF